MKYLLIRMLFLDVRVRDDLGDPSHKSAREKEEKTIL